MTEATVKGKIKALLDQHTDDYKIVGFGTKKISKTSFTRRYGIAVAPEIATQAFINALHMLSIDNEVMAFGGSEPMLSNADVLVEYFYIDVEYDVVREA